MQRSKVTFILFILWSLLIVIKTTHSKNNDDMPMADTPFICEEMPSLPLLDGTTPENVTRIAMGLNGIEPNGWSGDPSISRDGRYIAFASTANNLVPNVDNSYETPGLIDNTYYIDTYSNIYVYDRITEQTELVSIAYDGGDSYADSPSISGDGRFIVFDSRANFLPNDNNEAEDVFMYDRKEKTIVRVSIYPEGLERRGGSIAPPFHPISGNGRFVVFSAKDIFIRDLKIGVTTLISIDNIGHREDPLVSEDGQLIAFASYENNLVPNDNNGFKDIFVYDVRTKETKRVSLDETGNEITNNSILRSLSTSGRFVFFAAKVNPELIGYQIFVHDRETGQTKLILHEQRFRENDFLFPLDVIMSANERFLLFHMYPSSPVNANDLDYNPYGYGFYLYDLHACQIHHIAYAYDESDGVSAAFSADGRYIVFNSDDDTLVPNDTNHEVDLFLYENPLALITPTATPPATEVPATSTPVIITPVPTNTKLFLPEEEATTVAAIQIVEAVPPTPTLPSPTPLPYNNEQQTGKGLLFIIMGVLGIVTASVLIKVMRNRNSS